MLARELISDVVTALKTSDSGTLALSWMEVFRIKHLPIVNHREFLGLISDSDIYDLNDPDEPVGNHNLSLQKPYVNEVIREKHRIREVETKHGTAGAQDDVVVIHDHRQRGAAETGPPQITTPSPAPRSGDPPTGATTYPPTRNV